MILRHADVRAATKDWQTFRSDAPFRVPIPSEEDVRNVRQLPIETDPPEHTEYRKIVEPFFKRPRDPDFIAAIDSLIGGMVSEIWISCGVRVFHDPARGKASTLDGYIATQLDRAEKSPGEDFCSALTRTEYQGRKPNPTSPRLAFGAGAHLCLGAAHHSTPPRTPQPARRSHHHP